MKKSDGFLQSLEQYIYEVVRRSPLPYAWMGIGIIGLVVFVSLLNVKNSVTAAQNIRQVVEKASIRGDYELAQKLFEQGIENIEYRVLGAESDPSSDEASLEEKVYPDKVVERKITELEEQLTKTPNHFEIYLELSRLNTLIGNTEQSSEYREKARILDPNNAIFK
jgi:tetratricopeptide (TPR) repeat protein